MTTKLEKLRDRAERHAAGVFGTHPRGEKYAQSAREARASGWFAGYQAAKRDMLTRRPPIAMCATCGYVRKCKCKSVRWKQYKKFSGLIARE